MKDETKTENQSLIPNWDGITQLRRAWPEKVIAALHPFGTEKQGLWFTHGGIYKRLQEREGLRPDEMPQNLNQVLYGLVRSGHLERAIKPDKMRATYQTQQEYIYRRTAKAFEPKTIKGMNAPADDLERGRQIQLDSPRLPKWFRDMMMI